MVVGKKRRVKQALFEIGATKRGKTHRSMVMPKNFQEKKNDWSAEKLRESSLNTT